MVEEALLSYNISSNGSAGDWYWEVAFNRRIIARGLAPTMEQARADAVTAAAYHPSAEDLLEDALESLPLEAA